MLKKVNASNVMMLKQLVPYILSFLTEVIAPETRESITNQLNALEKASRKDFKEHVNVIKDKVENKGKTCPKCGRLLVLREGKYGKFLGCPGFPKCKYIYKGDMMK